MGHHIAAGVHPIALPLLHIGKAYAASPPGLPVGDFLPVALRLFVLGRDSAQLLGQVLYAAVVGISMLDDIPRQIGKSVFPAVARRGAVGRGVPAARASRTARIVNRLSTAAQVAVLHPRVGRPAANAPTWSAPATRASSRMRRSRSAPESSANSPTKLVRGLCAEFFLPASSHAGSIVRPVITP